MQAIVPSHGDKIAVSFSGGETSGYMSWWIKENYSQANEMQFIFANTGLEREETLEFVQQCDEYFGLNVVWVEAVINPARGQRTTAKVVDFKSASRSGEPFEALIQKYGIPNHTFPVCSRTLKRETIEAYQRQVGWRNRKSKPLAAIGIRADEFDRRSKNAVKDRIWYPLLDDHPTTKPDINQFWSEQPFRLNLKSWEGNCATCWKKSFKKLCAIAVTNPDAFKYFRQWEEQYGQGGRPQTTYLSQDPQRFFYRNKTVADIFEMAEGFDPSTLFDERLLLPNKWQQLDIEGLDFGGCAESCDGYGDDLNNDLLKRF